MCTHVAQLLHLHKTEHDTYTLDMNVHIPTNWAQC